VTAQDLIKYGFESEFVGRLPVIAVLEELTAEDLYEILANPNNPIINSKKRDFKAYGIDIKFEDEALRLLAERAARHKTGARGLVSVIERVLINFEKRLPSTSIRRLVVTPEVVKNPKEELERLLAHPDDPAYEERFEAAALRERDLLRQSIRRREQEILTLYRLPLTEGRVELIIDQYLGLDGDLKAALEEVSRLFHEVRRFEEKFFEEHLLEIHFDDEALDEILRQAMLEHTSARQICQGLAKDLEYALKLVRDRTSQDVFLLTREAIQDLDGYLNELIRQHYQKTLFRE